MFNELLFDETLLDDSLYQLSDVRSEMRDFEEEDYWDVWQADIEDFTIEDPWRELYAAV